jgi:Tripartite tricarboxylate transporter TctB family
MKIADQRDFVSGLGFVGFGGLTVLGSLRYDLGSASAMGPGYFPLITGVLLAVLGVIVLASACRPGSAVTRLDPWNVPKILIILTALILFALTLEPLGLVVAVPLLVAVSSAAHPPFSWRRTLLLIAIMLPLVWAIFVYFLGLTFPMLPAFI